MGYILRDKIKINRPIVFLCGPYYQKTNKSDRRNIMRKCFADNYRDDILPLIIDDFLTEDNLKDSNINIQLLEEIFAAISYKTYIFLDTLSAASELGLFMNHAFANKVVAYIPRESDILNKKNVGYFVKDVILKMNNKQAKCIEYRPSITRSVISTDYALEHYGFIGDVIPQNIENDIINDSEYKGKKENVITLEEKDAYPDEYYQIYYQKRNGKTFLHITVQLLFYIVISLMYEKYSNKLVSNKTVTIREFDIEDIQKSTIEVLTNFLVKKGVPVSSQIEISTILKFDLTDIVYHITTFCYVYHCFSTYKGLRLVEKHMDTILDNYIEVKGNTPLEVFGLSEEEYKIISQCADDNSMFYTAFNITKRGKRRELVKYSETEQGTKIRRIHEKMVFTLRKKYISSDNSFAYKKGGSIKKCVDKHRKNNGFIKYDISKFFNSINKAKLIKIIENIFDIDSAYEEITNRIVSSFYFDGKLPLGLVISPLLSDMYMLECDNEILSFCEKNNYIYTRYADDILISQKNRFTDAECKIIDDKLGQILLERSLKINLKKKKRLFLEKEGQHIKYIGINIVHFESGNKISVGKQYIYDVVKEYYQYIDRANENETLTDEAKKELFYEERRLAGKISFIKMIEGEEGWQKIRNRLGNNQEFFTTEGLRFNNIS